MDVRETMQLGIRVVSAYVDERGECVARVFVDEFSGVSIDLLSHAIVSLMLQRTRGLLHHGRIGLNPRLLCCGDGQGGIVRATRSTYQGRTTMCSQLAFIVGAVDR